MKKTSLYIDPEVDRALARRAVAEGVTKAELVRRVLAAAVVERPRPLARGVFEGARDLGSEADRHLIETAFGEQLAAVLDTSVVVAFINRRDEDHVRVSEWIEAAEEDLVTTPLVVAQIDHLVSYGGGPAAALAFYEDLASGAYVVEWWQEAMFEAVEAARSHQALGLELADASLLALAARLETARIATLDELHFRIVKPLTGQAAFVLLPADA